MDYGKALSVVRAAKGLSQKDLAVIIEKTPSYISRIEKDERTPTLDTINLICERLEIPVTLFMLLSKKYSAMNKVDKRLLDEMGAELLQIITKD
jgi:transcriptional regulator with XRE-family HTH domain